MNERILYLSGNESLDELKDLLIPCCADTVCFLFPRKSWIFKQNTDLLALRDFAEENNKSLVLITKNANARVVFQSMGIITFSSLEDKEKTPFEKMKEKNEDLFAAHKISTIPIEYLKQASKNQDSNNIVHIPVVKFSRPVIHTLFLLAGFLFVFILFLLSVVIPDARVTITPFQKEEEMHINIHMLSNEVFSESDLWRENNGVFTYPIEVIYEIPKTFSQVTKKFEGIKSSGKMKITNTLPEKLTFRKHTRMQNTEGVIFLTQDWVEIPAAKGGENGELVIDVEASERDSKGNLQGENANMGKGQRFIFPGLSVDTQSRVFAENTTALTGGELRWVYEVSQSNIDVAKGELIEAARNQKKKEFEYALSLQFPLDRHMEMLPMDDDQFDSEVLDLSFEEPEENLLGKNVTSFSGKIRVRIRNYAYSKDDLLEIIKGKFKRSAPEGMELFSVDNRVLTPSVLSVNTEKTRIKVSFSTRGVYQYVIEPKSKDGLLFSQKVKKEIVGMNAEKAKKELINNFPEISDVEIELWPFWVKTFPSLPEKIQLNTKGEEAYNLKE